MTECIFSTASPFLYILKCPRSRKKFNKMARFKFPFSILTQFWPFLSLTILLNCYQVRSDVGWFQVCDAHLKLALTPAECQLGLWLPNPLFLSCVCIHGVWALSTDLCDKDATVLVGAGECFNVNKNIRTIKYLGDISNPFSPSAYVVAKDFSSFSRVPTNGFSQSLGNRGSSMLIAVNPKRSFLRTDGAVCVTTDDEQKQKPVHIWVNRKMEPDRFRRVDFSKCPIPAYYEYDVNFGEVYQNGLVLPTDETSANCTRMCPIPPSSEVTKTTPTTTKPPISRYNSFGRSAYGRNAYMGRNAVHKPPPPPPPPRNSRPSSLFARHPPGRAAFVPFKRVDGPGVAVGKLPKFPSPGPPPKIQWNGLYSLKNRLEFMNGANLSPKEKEERKKIYMKRMNLSLPALSHARETREQSVRMVQAQINFYLMGITPPKVNSREYDYFDRVRQIFTALTPPDLVPENFILALSRMFRLLVWESHEEFQHRENPNWENYDKILALLDTCLVNVSAYPMYFVAYNLTDKKGSNSHRCIDETTDLFWNSTTGPDSPGMRRSPQPIPAELEFDYRRYDMVVELAWKMYLFVTYHCSDFFQHQAVSVHEFAAKIMSLFNYKIIKRWYDPQDFHLAVQTLFPGLDFDIITTVVDRLVAAAWYNSPWKTSWLSRPPLVATKEDTPRLKRVKRAHKTTQKPKPRILRLWDDTAICMDKFTDPVEKFGYQNSPSMCYPSNPMLA